MLDEIIAKIKALLGQSEEDEEEGTGVHEQTGVLDTKTNMQKPPSEDEEEEDDKAALRSKIIRLVVVGVIVYVALDEFVLVDPPPPAKPKKSARTMPKKKPKVAKKKPTPVPSPVALPESTPMATPEPVAETTPEPMAETTPEPVVEATPEATPGPVAENTPEATTEPTSGEDPEKTAEMEPDKDDPFAEIIEDAMVKPTPVPSLESPDKDPSKALDNLANDVENNEAAESAKGLSALGKALSKMKEEPKKKFTVTKAPDYLITGRGLVYNCRGKHWACVDKKSYFKCAANLKDNKKIGKRPDCGTVAVYQTEEDCQVIQLYNINTSQKTDFCSQ